MNDKTKERKESLQEQGLTLRNFNIKDSIYTEFKSVAKRNNRSVAAEVSIALERHINRENAISEMDNE